MRPVRRDSYLGARRPLADVDLADHFAVFVTAEVSTTTDALESCDGTAGLRGASQGEGEETRGTENCEHCL